MALPPLRLRLNLLVLQLLLEALVRFQQILLQLSFQHHLLLALLRVCQHVVTPQGCIHAAALRRRKAACICVVLL